MSAKGYSPDHPLSVVAAEFGYRNAASLQAIANKAGYKAGWDNIDQLREFTRVYRETHPRGATPRAKQKPRKAVAVVAKKKGSRAGINRWARTSEELGQLATELYPTVSPVHARKKVRDQLDKVHYKGPLTDIARMRAALPTATGGRSPVTIEGEAQAVPDFREARIIAEQIDFLYLQQLRTGKRKRSDPLLGLHAYMLGKLRGEV